MTEVRNGLERLLDAVTPFYKDKTEKLPPQQRKIINEIAQYSLEKNEGISPTEIAGRIRMTPNQVSTQLKRLLDNGYVKSLNIRGRSSFYVLSEPLYAIWAQMRFGRNAREKRNWLVQILKAIFDVQDMQKEIEKLGEKVNELRLDGRENKVRGVLEYIICLLETHSCLMEENFGFAVETYLELGEIDSIKAEISNTRLFGLSETIVQRLTDLEVIDKTKIQTVDSEFFKDFSKKVESFFEKISNDLKEKKYEEVYEKLDKLTSNLNELNDEIKLHWFFTVFLAVIYYIKFVALSRSNEITLANNEYEKALIMLRSYKHSGKPNDKKVSLIQKFLEIGKFNHLKSSNGKEKLILEMEKMNSDLEYCIKDLSNSSEREELINFEVLYHINKTQIFLLKGNPGSGKTSWLNYIIKLKQFDKENWLETASSTLMDCSRLTSLSNIRQLAEETEQRNYFSTLIYAIDFLEKKDESLIEKLSPEVRIVVEETIKTLQMIEEEKAKSETNQKKKTKKDRASEKSLALSE